MQTFKHQLVIRKRSYARGTEPAVTKPIGDARLYYPSRNYLRCKS